MHAYTVEPLYVKSGQEVIAADFYRPQTEHKPGVIIMAHGLACLRQFKLVQFAKRFAQAGYAVVLFDYRYWGGSTGRPRELVSLKSQLEDWRTMLMHVGQRKSIDSRKIVLWGISLSAGYALDIASENKNIQAVIAQNPFVDGAESAKLYPLQQLTKALKISSQDYMGAKVGMSPRTLPVADEQGLCFAPSADACQGYQSIIHPDYYWSGEIPARVFFNLIRYRPIQNLRRIAVPVLYIASKNDGLIPIETSREAATNIAPYAEYHEWEMQHFDIYHGKWFEKAVSVQLDFLNKHIGVG
ncbi:alpha/beta fold hydrolase [Acinetobacter sp. WCHAc010034]|uniref:alpha/beta hydrolase n=1 Tax=Acinetobacter sp. WCHAc010034 TaxID=1879049 RepID=UPI00083A3484|nr:alpha/beta fold hydrolase [Acinetobacter sp. WCHAc010034]AYA02887.1 alpha/beta fold hydrolase [Acinetobacter sp. WCHAc010034]